MYHPHVFRRFTGCLMAGAAVVGLFTSLGQAEAPEKNLSEVSVYHADPQHLWNRLHAALFLRVGSDGRAYGQDRLEPLLWSQSKHLLEERSHNQALALLEEFLKDKGEKRIDDPLKRALLQRDLWLIFHWLERDHNNFAEPRLKAEEACAAQQRLRRPLAAVIGRLALSPKAVRDLPDNYAAAVASGQFARRFDPEQPDKPYLPPELFAAEGPWVCVGRSDGLTAPQHLREDGANPFTNSVFLVFLRLPAGRAATVEYLKQLRSFDQPLLVRNPEEADRRSFPFVPNPKLPQFPKGTEVALVRQALLIDSSHRVAAAPLTESIQVRVISGEVPVVTKQVLDDAFRNSPDAVRRVGSWQSFHEFRLSRSDLFAGRTGGLRAVTDERDFKTGFNAHPWDEFERSLRADQSFREMSQPFTIRQTCFFCHSLPGVYSFNSFQDFRFGVGRNDGDKLRPLPLSEMAVSEVVGTAVKWKEGRPTWTGLQKLLAE